VNAVWIPLLLFVAGLGVLTAGAEFLVRGASRLALRYGVSPLVVGLTVVAFGTSAPELAVSVRAAFQGNGDIAVGNIVGSNIFNVAFILGLASLICPLSVHLQIVRREMPVMLVSAMIFVVMLANGGIARWEGLLLLIAVIAYTALAIRVARSEPASPGEVPDDLAVLGKERFNSVAVSAMLVITGLGLLVAGAALMVDNASLVARRLGVSEAAIGLTVVAAGTSLPELATSVVAALRRETDIAVGNIVGSNIFNVLCIGGVAGVIAPPVVATGITGVDFGFMLGTSFLVLPLMRTNFSISRWEGAVLLATYGLYLHLSWPSYPGD